MSFEQELGTDPWAAFGRWWSEADPTEPRVPDAVQVATVGPTGRPSLRTVLLKQWGPEGLVFFTNYGSRKARELDANPHIAMLLHWKGLERQVIIEGTAARASSEISDAYAQTRDRGSQLGAWGSPQSEPIDGREVLVERVVEVQARFGDEGPVPRPDFWGGYVVSPARIEFWQGRPDRLHDRLVFERVDGGWTTRRLAP